MSKVKLYVYSTEPGGMMARVAAWPGAHAAAASGEIAVEHALAILRADLSALRERGVELPDVDLTDPIVEPTTNGYERPEDMAPLSAGDLALLLHRLDLSRERLLALIGGRTSAQLARCSSEGWSLTQALEHIANAERWYTDRLHPWPDDPRAAAAEGRRLLLDRLAEAAVDGQDQVTVHSGEQWTPRLVLRRALEVERAWGGYIREVLAGAAVVQEPPYAWSGEETRPDEGPAFVDAEGDVGVADLARLGDDLSKELIDLSGEALDRAPGGGGCSIAVALRRLAGADWFLRSRLECWPADPLARLAAVRADAVARLARLDAMERARVTRALWGQSWTARHVLRRFIEHEQEHTEQIRRFLEEEQV
jgi:hypothetical protein